jgi:hypothetical protein
MYVADKDLWQKTVDNAMHDLLWATGGVNPDDPMVEAWQALRDALLVTEAHAAWRMR